MIEELRSYVGGEWRAGPRQMPDVNPARPSETVAEAYVADAELASQAVRAARAAFHTWRATPAPVRSEILRKAADLLEQRAERIGRDLTREEGKTLAEGIAETRRAVAIFRYYAGQALEPDGETFASHAPTTFLYARREPVGVVTVITPWNFPIALPAWKLAPALVYGNTVIWKPSELVPLTAVHLVRALVDAGLPEGVLNLILGKGSDLGDVLTTHAAVDAITFTGSNAVGREIGMKAAARGTRVQLELGGKNPAIVLADADLDHAAEQIALGAFLSAGQKCTATSRVIVERPVLRGLQERLVTLAETWRLGDPIDPDTKVGPVVSQTQLDSVMGYLATVAAEGGSVLTGGTRAVDLGDGYFVRPTVIAGLRSDSRVMREEIFGPVVGLIAADSYDEAVVMANDTPFGLVASLFTSDLTYAMRFADEARVGVVKVNQETAGLEFQVPFGGTKASSSGSHEQGRAAREFFTEWKTVYLARARRR